MRFQVVVQFDWSDADNLERLFATEQRMGAELTGDAVVDGHDFGSGEFNIFVLTNDPSQTYKCISAFLLHEGIQSQARIACRAIDGDIYTVMWPSDLHTFRVR